jgi:hypothetical protein
MTPEGYFGPQYYSNFQPVTPEGVGGKVPPAWGQSANSFLQGSPLPAYQAQPPWTQGGSQAGTAVTMERRPDRVVWPKPKRSWAVAAGQQGQDLSENWPPARLMRPGPFGLPWRNERQEEQDGPAKEKEASLPIPASQEDKEVARYTEQAGKMASSPSQQEKEEQILENCSPISSPEGTPLPGYEEEDERSLPSYSPSSPREMKLGSNDPTPEPTPGPSVRSCHYEHNQVSVIRNRVKDEPKQEEYIEGHDKPQLPAKFKRGFGKREPSPPGAGQVDWGFRLGEIDINALIYDEPPLWFYPKATEDLDGRQAVRLMDLVRNRKLQLCEFAQLEERYGLFWTEICRRFEVIESSELTEVTAPSLYVEMTITQGANACPGCNVPHPPGEAGGSCPPKHYNSPKVLGLLGDDWPQAVRGMMIGTSKLRVQPPSLRNILLNGSCNASEAVDYSRAIGPYSTDREVKSQNLYKALKARVDLTQDYPEKPILIEYGPMPQEGLEPGAVPISWGPIKIVQALQRLAHNPLVLILPTLTPQYGMNDATLKKAKRAYVRSARELTQMCRALGVPLVPLAVHTLEVQDVWVKGRTYKPEFLWNRLGDPSREHNRRVAEKLTGLLDMLEPATLTKQQWLEALEAAG